MIQISISTEIHRSVPLISVIPNVCEISWYRKKNNFANKTIKTHLYLELI